ncbi:amino acid ABC transporter substrate-binding protein [Defluviitalea phaphyphila]|uniref:amino acid ABC transporter substrate-binding protein n=1 Tax=Defluviitalea phaphyphila TaxID=1473580 RepID=UPI0007314776|nr:amino acid ABC transporter substrate-binding protein [Defluviitalea phaphyphila]
MKKNIILLLCSILVIALFSVGCGSKDTEETLKEDNSLAEDTSLEEIDNSLEEIKEKGVLVVGLDDTFAPMGFRDESGEIVGFDIDLAREVAKRMGVEIELKPINWDAKTMELNGKNIDVIWNGLSITEERKKEIAFSDPYLNNRQIIIVRSDSDIETKKDLEGKIVGLQTGSSAETALNADSETASSIKEISDYPDNTTVLMELEAGRLDAAVMDEVVGKYYISKKPDNFKVLEEDFGRESYGIGFRLTDKKLVEEVNKIMEELKEDGTAAEISKKWFGEDIVVK